MGQTAQASGTASLSNGQSQAVTSGWRSDASSVATVTDAGLVTGVSNGRATIYVVYGGRQGQQLIRVVPDYQGSWEGGLRVTSCSETGVFPSIDFCKILAVGTVDGYSLALAQAGEQMTARLAFGSITFPTVPAPIGEDGLASFAATYVDTSNGLAIDATVAINSLRIGELTGTVSEVWTVPGETGEGRLEESIVGTTRTSTTARVSGTRASDKLRLFDGLRRP